jgi:hypothetical protein
MRRLIAAGLVMFPTGAALALDCPQGAYPWVGRNGIEYCKRDVIGPQGRDTVETCAAGTRLSTDRGGNRICTKIGSSSR